MTDRSRAGQRANGSTPAGIRLDGPKNPANDDVPPPAPTWKPDVREPDLLPDELPVRNPDENRSPPNQAGGKPFPGPGPTPGPDPQPQPPPGPNPTPQPTPI